MVEPATPKRILYVEDHADLRRLLERLLASRHYLITCAGNCAEAMRCIELDTYDVIVSDLRLPDGTGWDLLPMVRTLQNIPAIAVSGLAMPSDLERSRQAGFCRHLTKPFQIGDLLEALEYCLNAGARSEADLQQHPARQTL